MRINLDKKKDSVMNVCLVKAKKEDSKISSKLKREATPSKANAKN